MTTTYHATSNFYGSCGHKHQTIASAERCVCQHRRALAKNGSYGDRRVERVDGELFSDEEINDLNQVQGVRMTGRWVSR